MKTKTQPVASPVVETPAKETALVAAPVAMPVVKPEPSPEFVERMGEVQEALETFSDLKLPVIRFKEGFTLTEGEEVVESFEGTIVYTKESNIYFENRYRPGSTELPRCMSMDGKTPCVDKPINPTCKGCPMNEYGSAKDGAGKACKNTRPVYIVTPGAVIPRVLRVPPTSLPLIKSFILSVATDHGSYLNVLTRFTVFKKVESQTHYNVRCGVLRRLTPVEKAEVQAIREAWLVTMREKDIGLPDEEASQQESAPPPPVDEASGMQY